LTAIDPSAVSIRGLFPLFGIDSLGVEPFVIVLRKRTAPSVGKVKDRYVKDEQGVVPGCAMAKKVAYSASEIIFTLFRFHGAVYLSNANGHPAHHHQAVVGFTSPSFEGGIKDGVTSVGWIGCVVQAVTA
jgi:hypothetical protein